jgi:hypothetical protein
MLLNPEPADRPASNTTGRQQVISDSPSGAEISAAGVYRYRLWRSWDPTRPGCTWIMLNPSTADGLHDDPTIRRCIGFATRWGFGRIDVFNLFGLRTSDPRELRTHPNPVGPANDARILEHARALTTSPYRPVASTAAGTPPMPYGPIVVCAWGATFGKAARVETVRRHLERQGVFTSCVGELTKDGHPRHPLYLPGDAKPEPFV